MSAKSESDYKYKARFRGFAKVVPEQVKEGLRKEAMASLSNLSSVFADEAVVKRIKENPDLLFFASNLILCDYANLNDDCVTKEDILAIADKFKLKQLNLEHDRNEVRGAICEVGYSLYPSNLSISESIAKEISDPIQFVIGAYLWRVVDNDLCNFVESASNENSPDYGAASTSFELFFDFYDIAVGSGEDRDVKKSRKVSPESEEWGKYDAFLRSNGGTGKDDNGNIVYRILKGDIHPAGAGIVSRPASGLKGVLAVTANDIVEDEEEDCDEEHETEAVLQEKNINSSNAGVSDIITSTEFNTQESIMKIEIKSIEDLATKWSELSKLEAKAAIENVREFMEGLIAEKSTQFAEEQRIKEELIQTVEANKVAAETKVTELETAIADLQAQLKQISEEKAASEAEATFNVRMSALDETFELEDEDRSILVEEVQTLDSTEEAFAKWMDKKKKLLKEKTKAYKKAQAELQTKVTTTASTKEAVIDVKEVLASVTETEGQKIANTSETSKDLKAAYATAFGDGLEVNGMSAKDYLTKSAKQ